ncbi:SUMF1/EgtB/PvdO family nonheme iron enzyme [Roseimicrobium sp. ORNL1]|uniref:formylglycine-generating enzyme family protein n=1 Tax=Roseimicrobium sp. ORNL1 TaxID=2711231 RepID=UPI0013E11D81|nr:SUMF1/EgtB/PvdO family nonheme iron enzyme [Roseimicrobium sp. ORNL1]QIF04187.1 formylglycine-generating enzyme family protein [Roseimicrobium sp. ORNL1]
MFLLALAGFLTSADAQELTPDGKFIPGPTPGPNSSDAKPALKNSQGMPMMEIPGTPVYLAAWETRVSDFRQFVEESGYLWKNTPFFPQTDTHPVVNVSLRDAMMFCAWLTQREQASGLLTRMQSYRLPTQREWDAAVGLAIGRSPQPTPQERERDTEAFPWGMEWPPPQGSGNFNSLEISGKNDGFSYTAPVGSFGTSPEGLADLAGNVWEWTWDQPPGGETNLQPSGALRGGSWMYFRKESLLSAYQYKVPGETRSPSIGFRYVLEDRPRMAAFLAQMEKSKAEIARQRRSELMDGPQVTEDEVQKMREKMERRSADVLMPAPKSERVPLPDVASLKPAQAGQPYTNTLGMSLRPLGAGGRVFIGEHEVRVQDYEAGSKPWRNRPNFPVSEIHPVVNVSWEEANQFCEWLTGKDRAAKLIPEGARYRLPTDAEWSHAAGLEVDPGATPAERHLANKTDFPWGREAVPPKMSANLDTARMSGYQDIYTYTAPVGSFSPNSLHVYDLAGNVSEWCSDEWPGASGEKVVRGSSWLSFSPDTLLSSARQHLPANAAKANVGFRVVLEMP